MFPCFRDERNGPMSEMQPQMNESETPRKRPRPYQKHGHTKRREPTKKGKLPRTAKECSIIAQTPHGLSFRWHRVSFSKPHNAAVRFIDSFLAHALRLRRAIRASNARNYWASDPGRNIACVRRTSGC